MKLDIRCLWFACIVLLAACGGGGTLEKNSTSLGGGSTGGSTESTPISLALSVTNTDGTEASELSSTNTLLITAQLSGDGNLADRVIAFSLDNTALANFDNDTNSALTDANGTATISLTVGTVEGAGNIVGTTAGDEGNDITDTVGFYSAGDGVSQTVNVASVDLIASSLRLPSAGNDVIEVTAIVSDENFVLLENVEVAFQVTSGKLNIVNAMTDSNGQAKAEITSVVQKPNRLIDVNARAANQSDELQIEVIGTNISINGPESMVQGDTAQLTIELVDSDNSGIAGENVTITSTNGNTISDMDGNPLVDNTATTGANGQILVNVTADFFDVDQITVAAFGNSDVSGAQMTTASKNINVLSDEFTLSIESIDDVPLNEPCSGSNCVALVELGAQANLQLSWQSFGENVVAETVQFSTTRGSISPAAEQNTDNMGAISLDLEADNAGPAVVTATGTRSDGSDEVIVSTQLALEFVASEAETVNVQTSKTSIAGNGEESSIIATVRDPNGNLVKGKTVQFKIVSDTGNGSITPAEDVTDGSGVANTTYTSNGVTGLDGVVIEATVKDTPAVSDTVSLTVADKELFIVVGTGNEILQDTGIFQKPFRVFVTDVDSNPLRNKELQVSAVPVHPLKGFAYRKGVWTARYDGANFRNWEPTYPVEQGNPQGYPSFVDSIDSLNRVVVDCYNEDYNVNGILDIDVDGNDMIEQESNATYADNDGVPQSNEDYNQDGFITPGNVVSVIGSLLTDDDGMAEFSLSYPQNYAAWVDVNIVVSASVAGTESTAEMIYTLGFSSSYVLNEFNPPPANPFGDNNVCSNID